MEILATDKLYMKQSSCCTVAVSRTVDELCL